MALFGCYAPKPPVAPLDPPLPGRSARRLLRSGEWGDLAAERQGRKKFHVFRIKGWILDPWGGRVNARNEKNPLLAQRVFRSLRVSALIDLVTGPQRDPATEGNSTKRMQLPKHSFSLAASSHSSSKIPPRTCYQWPLPVAQQSARLGIMSCRRVGCRGRPRRGNPHMAKRATAHHSLLRLSQA